MSLLSLEKYLYTSQKNADSSEQQAPLSDAPPVNELAEGLLDAWARTLFASQGLSDLAEELRQLRTTLQAGSNITSTSEIVSRAEALLTQLQQRLRQADEERATEFKNVLDLLNEAFAHLNSGTDKSDNRRKQLESALGQAAQMQDLQTLKMHLNSVLRAVQQEGRRDSAEARGALEKLSLQIRQVHKASSRSRPQLSGRVEALTAIKQRLGSEKNKTNPQVALFVADSVAVIRSRHGEEVAAHLLEEFGRQQLQPLVEGAGVFPWSSNALLMIWDHSGVAGVPSDVPHRLKTPFEHKAFVGARTATFNLNTRSVVMPVQGSCDELEWALDRFLQKEG